MFIFRIIWWFIKLPFRFLGWMFAPPSENSAAGRYIKESREYCERDLKNYRAKQAKRDELIRKAENLEQLARYGMPYEQKEKLRQAAELRRQADRL